jgi:hypothetical protein
VRSLQDELIGEMMNQPVNQLTNPSASQLNNHQSEPSQPINNSNQMICDIPETKLID